MELVGIRKVCIWFLEEMYFLAQKRKPKFVPADEAVAAICVCRLRLLSNLPTRLKDAVFNMTEAFMII